MFIVEYAMGAMSKRTLLASLVILSILLLALGGCGKSETEPEEISGLGNVEIINMESIIKKLGFDPLTYEYYSKDNLYEDDSIPNPLMGLDVEELE